MQGGSVHPSIESSVNDIFYADWNITSGIKVPTTDDVVMKNGGRLVDATYLYADLAGSSKLAHTMKKETTAVIVRTYISTAARMLRSFGGEIRSFDGDRIMAIFMGDDKNRNAVEAGFGINWAVYEVLRPAIESKWTDVSKSYTVSHGIGIATGEALIVRGGVREHNDLISVGNAPNDAAHLSEYRAWTINITKAVHDVDLRMQTNLLVVSV
jgi:adenylate cyclase